MTSNARFRYALMDDNSIIWFTPFSNDNYDRRNTPWLGVSALSVHSYSQKLKYYPKPTRIWGDLQLIFHCRHEMQPEEIGSLDRYPDIPLPLKATNFFRYYRIPLNCLTAYFQPGKVTILIPEKLFRGDIGAPWRLDFDRAIQRRLGAVEDVENHMNPSSILFSKAALLAQKLQHPKVPISPMAELYFDWIQKAQGRSDYFLPAPAFILKCSVFSSLVSQHSVTEEDLAKVCTLSGMEPDLFLKLIVQCGSSHLLSSLDRTRFNTALQALTTLHSCADIMKLLTQFDKKYPCKENCGVTSPHALAYTCAYDLTQATSHLNLYFDLHRDGVYSFGRTRKRVRVMDPIWAEDVLGADSDLVQAKRIHCYDRVGFKKAVTISVEGIRSPQLFNILSRHDIHLPSDKYEKGLLRRYLLSLLGNRNKSETPPRFSVSRGWQADGSFVFPCQDNDSSNRSLASSLTLPKGENLLCRIPPFGDMSSTADPYVLLAITAALAAPFLKPHKLSGVAVHFYGGTQAKRLSAVLAASSVWSGTAYSFRQAHDHLRELKQHYKDTALCIYEVPQPDIKSMRSLVRRFFNGRKGAEEGVVAVIVSSGESPLGQTKNHQESASTFVDRDKLLGIDIKITDRFIQAFIFDAHLTNSLVESAKGQQGESTKAIQAYLEEGKTYWPSAPNPTPIKQAQKFLSLCFAIGRLAQAKQPDWWHGGPLSEIFNDFMIDISHHHFNMLNMLQKLKMHFPSNLLSPKIESRIARPLIQLSKRFFLVRTDIMTQIAQAKSTRLEFTRWLEKEKILLPKRSGILCGEYYSPKHKKTIRAYKVDRSRLYKVLAQLDKYHVKRR
ncbi:DUF927 domain-containing protein [Paucidesulfovibrio longus]|uniref:DUF927 domain-containing protein n=1 Tax=Paucidesulfovibrio longus TaxID=889 RepID=UPI00042A1840|nr:DUF927 domain-containing protein [Paucidesulfovibrio longus]